ncbi:MBL fold metallo-hydrolase [Thiomicrorhabdus cannonii]|uniref:MBL fold metallo-hydrolase n=1 Tax=Thiomicrorhabdus cannonii TaxID=2748011 RepID=UPI0015C012EA|nr:MBL fold metallo-hydrolase [Thiomicrorhabdus cannonii]
MFNPLRSVLVAGVFMLLSVSAQAEKSATLEVQKLEGNVYALVGEMAQRNPQNLGNNSTHGVVVLKNGVLLIDSGGSYLGAQAIHKAIQSVTDKPVKWVVNTGGQDHRWFGNGYFKEQGAKIYASAKAVEDQKAHCQSKLEGMARLIGEDKLQGTQCVYADETFETNKTLTLDGESFELHHAGPAHTLGNAFVWMPSTQTAFVGDMVYNERILGLQYTKDVKGWIATFEAMARLKPKWVVPGHGHAGDLARAQKDTYDYLVFLRDEVSRVLDEGGDMIAAGKIDQSRFNYLIEFDALAPKNALWVFERLEFE